MSSLPIGLEQLPKGSLPFLKWAGGKRWLVCTHQNLFPSSFKCYLEPFLGSGAVYFALKPAAAKLSDANEDLIQTYEAIRDFPDLLSRQIELHHRQHSNDHYYRVRSIVPKDSVKAAARLIYMNRVCYNGLYRVNRSGLFNVPIGTKTNVVLKSDDFRSISALLRDQSICCSDFEASIKSAARGDFIFADPPYTVKHDNNGFIKYNETLFSWSDQVRLKECLDGASSRGALIMVTNANHPSILELYKDYSISTVERNSVISGSVRGRATAVELVIRNFENA